MKKRIISLLLVLVMALALMPTMASASSYPLIFPEVYNPKVEQGETITLSFTIFPAYKNEKIHVRIYDSDSNYVGGADTSKYNTSSMYYTKSYTWDTSDVEPGVYTMVYYMEFYSMYSWHEAPNRYSTTITVVAGMSAPSVKVSNNASTGKPVVSWGAVSGASKYTVYRAQSKTGRYTKMITTSKTSYTDSTAVAGKTYYYKVVPVSATGKTGPTSSIVSGVCDCARPVVSATTTSTGKPKLSWSAVSGASTYAVYRATSKSGTYSRIVTTLGKSYIDSSAVKGRTYYYKVVALSAKTAKANSAYSTVKSIKATR